MSYLHALRVLVASFGLLLLGVACTAPDASTTRAHFAPRVPTSLYVPSDDVLLRLPIYVEQVGGFDVIACFALTGYKFGGLKKTLGITKATCLFANKLAAFTLKVNVFDARVEA